MTNRKYSWAGNLSRFVGRPVAVLAALALHAGIAIAQLAVPGTSVTMTPPEGFTIAGGFTGFENVEKKGSFLVAEFPAEAASQLSGLFADQSGAAAAFAQKGITVESREEIDNADGDTIPLLRGSQEANGVTLEKWMALYAADKVVMITFQIPKDSDLDEDAMKAAFASVKLAGAASEPEGDPRLAELPYELDIVEPFRLASVTNHTGALLTVGPKDVDPEATQPQIVVTYTQTGAPAGDLKTFANIVMNALGDDVTTETQEDTMFADLDGIASHGTFTENGVKKNFVQIVAPTGSGAFIGFIGTASQDKYEGLKDVMEEIAASVAIKG
ncbi:hypothetical protein [Rhizobium sp. BT03]|uniref:hypothetical protein n=1 Tax=Rhizobium sp. BT03 TaxID=3045156 RepID=UPI0024B3D9C5|nr:hypothetical protein [Rhizobium sp. BT03]WHO71412.1 hypothetical protein QMO80_000401 [Rhizobium sp. BT03]